MKFPTKTPTKRWFSTATDGTIIGNSRYYTTEKYNKPSQDAYDDKDDNGISDWFEKNKLTFIVTKINPNGTTTDSVYYLDYLISLQDKINDDDVLELRKSIINGETILPKDRFKNLLKEYVQDKIKSGYTKKGIKAILPEYLIKNDACRCNDEIKYQIKEDSNMMQEMACDFDSINGEYANWLIECIEADGKAYVEQKMSNYNITGTASVAVTATD